MCGTHHQEDPPKQVMRPLTFALDFVFLILVACQTASAAVTPTDDLDGENIS